MGRYLTVTIASILGLAIAGCAGEEEQTVAPIPTETVENNQSNKPKPFEDPVVPGKTSTTVAQTPSNLIQPTNPTERVGIVTKGRTDPFDEITSPVFTTTPQSRENTVTNNRTRAVPVLPPLPASSTTTASRQRARRSAVISATAGGNSRRNSTTAGGNSRRNSNSSRTALKQQPKQTPPKANSNGGSVTPANVVPKVMPGVIPQPDLASVLPPPPEPKLAQAVLVSGVIQVGNQPQAIIKVPSEPTSRYVQAGQRLASGLLVKRIEMNEGSEPIVILEQYGIEVARMVGEAPMGAIEPTTASTENPVSTLPSLPKRASVGAS
jgi:hypothetical protein